MKFIFDMNIGMFLKLGIFFHNKLLRRVGELIPERKQLAGGR